MIFYINWKLSVCSLVLLPFYIMSLLYFSAKIRNQTYKSYEANALLTKKLQESISNISLFKSFVAEKFDAKTYVNFLKKATIANIKKLIIGYISNIINAFISGLSPIIIILYGAYLIINGELTLGQLIAFNSFIGYLFGPTSRLAGINVQIQHSLAALSRVYEMFNTGYNEVNRGIMKVILK